MGIIGVVSAMTVPTLMQNYQKKSYVTQLHKVYNELNQALLQYQTDNNAVNIKEAGLNSTSAYNDFQKKYFKVVQDCGSDSEPCFADSYRKISGVDSNFTCTSNCMVIASGVSIGCRIGSNNIVQFVVDVNGTKGPNIYGRDAFSLYLYSNGVIDDLTLEDIDNPDDYTWGNNITPTTDQREKNFERACLGSDSNEWHGCFGKILNDNWEMTY